MARREYEVTASIAPPPEGVTEADVQAFADHLWELVAAIDEAPEEVAA